MKKLILFTLLSFILVSCGSQPVIQNVMITPGTLNKELSKPPFVQKLTNSNYPPSLKKPSIFYRIFTFLNTPTTVKNWKELFVINGGSIPNYSYTEIAKIQFLQKKNDQLAIERMIELAQNIGGDAVIDFHRVPATENSYIVSAYLYLSTVIIKN